MVARETMRAIGKVATKMQMRMRGMITRSRVAASSVTGQGQSLTLDMYEGEQRDSVEYFETYGVSGAVPTGSTCLAFAAGGSRDQIIALGASPKGDIPAGKLAGEVDYWSVHGQRIRHHAAGDTSIQPGATGIVYVGSDVNPLLPFVNGHGDPCMPSAAMSTWMTAVTVALTDVGIVAAGSMAYAPPPPIPGLPIASTVATATKTKVA